jgi:N-acetylglucosamine-6-sulfatase
MAQRPGRIVLSLTLGGLTLASGLGRTDLGARAAAASPPNIVVLLADDLDVVSFQAAVEAGFLPHITELFAPGTRFRQSFVSEALCTPSRATFFTGLYPHNHGIAGNSGRHGGFDNFTRAFGDNNLAVWMQGAGYRTAHVGKYINGYEDGTVVPRGWDEWQGLVDPTTYYMYGYDVSNNGHPVHYGHRLVKDYQTDVLAGLAVDFVRASRAQGDTRPLFLSLAPVPPHRERDGFDGIRPAPRHYLTPRLPLPRPPSFNEADMSDKPGWMQKLPPVDEAAMAKLYNQRIASMRAVDDLLGRVVDAVGAIGELERTAFVFASDNGYLLGKHRWEAKILLYEEAIRVPMMMRVPGLAGPAAVDEIVLNNDIAPTVAALAGAAPGLTMDGRSLLPLLDGTAAAWRKRFEVTYPPQVAGPALDEAGPEAAPTFVPVPPFFAVRTGADGNLSDLIYAETIALVGSVVTDRELYDLRPRIDPFQLDSRHADLAYLSRRLQLKQHLDALRACGDGTCQALEE